MFRPKFLTKRAEALYEILKRLWFIGILIYLPLMMGLALISDLQGSAGFFDLGFCFCFSYSFGLRVPFIAFSSRRDSPQTDF